MKKIFAHILWTGAAVEEWKKSARPGQCYRLPKL